MIQIYKGGCAHAYVQYCPDPQTVKGRKFYVCLALVSKKGATNKVEKKDSSCGLESLTSNINMHMYE